MDYISFVPIELIELIIPYLETGGLESFLKYHDVKNFINWSTVYTLHFNKIRNINYGLYFSFLSIEKLKEKLNLEGTEEEIYNWKSLNLSRNSIEEIPREIGELINLKQLDLNNNRIKEIPEFIGKLINLKSLYLNNNKISEIPLEIGNLIKLKYLGLSFNQLTEIPDVIGKLINLKSLYLNNNKIIKIHESGSRGPEPKGLKNLINLEVLFLSNNKLDNNEINKLRLLLPNTHFI